jgi:very-short-patch-repair endonuclease
VIQITTGKGEVIRVVSQETRTGAPRKGRPDAALVRAGYRILRFQAELVLRETHVVVARIRSEL